MIDKKTFCAVIENLRQQYYLDQKFGDNIEEMFGARNRCSYNDGLLYKTIMTLLRVYFPKDADGFCLIEHYCMIIEFGKKENSERMSAEDLYDELVLNLA